MTSSRHKSVKRPTGKLRRLSSVAGRRGVLERIGGARRNRSRGATGAAQPRTVSYLRALVATFKVLLVLAVMAGCASAGYWGYRTVVKSSYFVVEQIEFAGVSHAPPEELRKLLSWVRGYSIFRLPMREAKRRIESHPWVAGVTLSRQLPRTLHVEVAEHEPVAAVLLGHLYLVNARAQVFKRASMAELEGLAIITGIERLDYLNRSPKVNRSLERALEVLERYQGKASRPVLSEVHVGDPEAVTLFLREGGAAIRLGRKLTEHKLRQLDSVLAALGPEARRARAVYLDHEKSTDRVVVRMASYD
jgi:cell division protein FtsQ